MSFLLSEKNPFQSDNHKQPVGLKKMSCYVQCLYRKRKSEHSVVIHVQLSGSLFLLHLFFLASTLGSGSEKKPVCQCLGLILHWTLIATFTWNAIEGFHLYLLLVRVFNIYIRRYLLKLSLVGWGKLRSYNHFL